MQPFHALISPQEVVAARERLVEDLRDAMAGFANEALEALLGAGVAYHHAGLTMQEHQAVEVIISASHNFHSLACRVMRKVL